MRENLSSHMRFLSIAVALGSVIFLSQAVAQSSPGRKRVFLRTLRVGQSFAATSDGCRLTVRKQSATSVDVACTGGKRVPTGRARIALKLNEYGTVRSRGCALSVASNRASRVNVRCVAVKPATVFIGSVTCDDPADAARQRVLRTSVVFDQPITPSTNIGSATEKLGDSAQVGGLAGELVADRQSRMKLMSVGANSSEREIRFDISFDSRADSFKEKGSWRVGVNAKGKPRLTGQSTAELDSSTDAWRSKCKWDLSGSTDSIVGSIPVRMIEKILTPPTSGAVTASDGGCGSMYNTTTAGLSVAANLFSFCGPASAVFNSAAAITSAGASAAGSACLASELESINQQLATQAYEIQQIQNYLGLATNIFYYAWYKLQVDLTSSDVKSWRYEALEKVTPVGLDPNAFGTFMTELGLWDSYLQPDTGAAKSSQQLAVNLTDSQFRVLTDQIVAGQVGGFQSWVNNFSGTQPVVLNQATCGSNCVVTVAPDSGSYLLRVYADLFDTLQSNVNLYVPTAQEYNQTVNQNVVPLYDQYNTMLVYFYQQAVVGLQQAFTMEWLVNQINYFRATGTANTAQLPSWGQVGGTLYTYKGYSASDEAAAYNTAQTKLATLYAERFNRLYLNTLNWVVSDVPVSPQAYPTARVNFTVAGKSYSENPVDYAADVGSGIPKDTTGSAAPEQGATPLSLLPTALTRGTTWQSAAVLYQFAGLYDVAKCISSLQAYNTAASSANGSVQDWLRDPAACPPILVLADGTPLNQGIYDGNTLAPYTSFQASSKTTGSPMALTGTMTNNLKFCDATTPAPGWYAPSGSFVGNAAGLVGGKAYLNCGRWYLPGGSSFCGFPRANCAPDPKNLYTDFGATPAVGLVAAEGSGCTNNLKMNGNKYPWIITLTDYYPTEMKSCSAVLPTVVYGDGTKLSPNYTNARTESGSYWSSSSAGCSIGFIGTGLSNQLPRYRDMDVAQFGLRVMNYTDSGNTGSSGGWMLPLKVETYCDTTLNNPNWLVFGWGGGLQDRGYSCTRTGQSGQEEVLCTILDGTQYVLKWNEGSSAQLAVQVVRP